MYRRLAEELGVSHRVLFLGYVKDAFPYQNLMDLNLNASRGTETTCLATSECMSLGIPTVASDFGGNPEMVRDGESGLLFPSENLGALVDAIHRVVMDGRLYHELSLGARRAFEQSFSLSRMLERYRRLYRSLAHKSLLPDLWKMIAEDDPFVLDT